MRRARGASSAVLAVAILANPVGEVMGQPVQVSSCPMAGAAVAEPYRWYPSLDLGRIPFHVAAGPWGPRAPIEPPAAPVTRRTVEVSSASQFAAEARNPGTTIVVAVSYIGPVTLLADVVDIDIVVPRGRTIAQLTIGRYNPPSTTRRVRIRGTTTGVHSGGVVGNITFHSSPLMDIIIDGVDLNGADGNGGSALWQFSRPVDRVAVVNVRGHSVGPATVHQRGGTDIVIAGSRIMSGARSREVNGYVEAWGIRGGDRVVIFDNRIEGTRYHLVRVHPRPGPAQYAWVGNNVFIDRHEARIFNAFDVGDGARYAAVWAVCNQVFAHSACMSPSFQARDAAYAMLTSNAFFGSITEASQRQAQSLEGPHRDYVTGNTFATWQAPPAWTPPGDPGAIPLPPAIPGRYNAALAVKPCPPP
jgi:hypothetical protein